MSAQSVIKALESDVNKVEAFVVRAYDAIKGDPAVQQLEKDGVAALATALTVTIQSYAGSGVISAAVAAEIKLWAEKIDALIAAQ